MYSFLSFNNDKYDINSELLFLYSNIINRKNTINNETLLSAFEINRFGISKIDKPCLWSFLVWYVKKAFNSSKIDFNKHITSNIVFFDMLYMYKAWRHIKGYPVNGQRTWSNGNSSSKNNKSLKSFRYDQYVRVFGSKKRTNYQTLIQAEYTNKLWAHNWVSEWLQARRFCIKSIKKNKPTIQVDIVSLSKNMTTGYKRKGKAAKQGKSKKVKKNVTIGLPIYFTKYLFTNATSKKFPYKIQIVQEKKIIKKLKKKKK